MEIPYISLHDFAAINDSLRTRVRHFDPNFWQWLEEQLKALKATLADKSRLNREFFLEDVMKNDDSVKFYTGIPTLGCLKDGAYYCYCAYVLRISRYSSFLSVMLTNTGIFLRGLKLSGESR